MATQASPSNSAPGRAYRSRLEPYVDFIRDERRRRRTWAEIAKDLGLKGVSISFQGVYQFYRRRLARKPSWEMETVPTLPTPTPAPSPAPTPPRREPPRAALPAGRDFRRPDLSDLTLNDPLKP